MTWSVLKRPFVAYGLNYLRSFTTVGLQTSEGRT